MPAQQQPEEDEFELIEHSTPVDVEKLNRELFERNQDLWDALDEARWCPFNHDSAIQAASKRKKKVHQVPVMALLLPLPQPLLSLHRLKI